jgi:hypothetical protein
MAEKSHRFQLIEIVCYQELGFPFNLDNLDYVLGSAEISSVLRSLVLR